jgi:iron-sulfur cluster repair protein YtfE (RIC family)
MVRAKSPGTDKVLDEHRSLRALLGQLEDTLAHPPEAAERPGWIGTLGETLEDLRGKLEKHFRSEEENGFFEEIETSWPNASARCDLLKQEHGTLLAHLDEVLAGTIARPTADAPFQTLVVRTCSLIKDLTHHEERENELLYISLEGGPEAQD